MLKCVSCLSDGIETESDVIVSGYSYCFKHAVERCKREIEIYDKVLGKRR